jgi:hypothetical protein
VLLVITVVTSCPVAATVMRVMADKVDAWAWLMAPIVKADPYMDYGTWLEEYYDFRDAILAKTSSDFQAYLQNHYTVQ